MSYESEEAAEYYEEMELCPLCRRHECECLDQRTLRAVRDAIQKIHDSHDPGLERDERLAINDHVLALFEKGGRFEVDEEPGSK